MHFSICKQFGVISELPDLLRFHGVLMLLQSICKIHADEPKKYQNSDIMTLSRIPRELIQQLLESSDKILIFNFPLIFNLKRRKYYCKKSIVGLGLITSKIIIHNLCPFANSMGYFLFAQKSHELFYADFWAFCTCCIVWKGSVKIIFLQRSVLRIRENIENHYLKSRPQRNF